MVHHLTSSTTNIHFLVVKWNKKIKQTPLHRVWNSCVDLTPTPYHQWHGTAVACYIGWGWELQWVILSAALLCQLCQKWSKLFLILWKLFLIDNTKLVDKKFAFNLRLLLLSLIYQYQGNLVWLYSWFWIWSNLLSYPTSQNYFMVRNEK